MNVIVAVDENWAIGYKDELLVSIPNDHKMFREMTTGKVVVLGRKTLSTFPQGRPLKNRTNIILTTQPDYAVEGALVAHSLEEYLQLAEDLGANKREVFTKIILPLSVPGIYSGIVMVFMPTVSTFAIAELLTHNKITLFGSLIQRSFGEGGIAMWNYGAALSLIMLIIIALTSFFDQGDKDDAQKGGLV